MSHRQVIWLLLAMLSVATGCVQAAPSASPPCDRDSQSSKSEQDGRRVVEIWLFDQPEKMVGAEWDPKVINKFGFGHFPINGQHKLRIHLPNGAEIELESLFSIVGIDQGEIDDVSVMPTNGVGLTFKESVAVARSLLNRFEVPPDSRTHRRISQLEHRLDAGESRFHFYSADDLKIYDGLQIAIELSQFEDGVWTVQCLFEETYERSTRKK